MRRALLSSIAFAFFAFAPISGAEAAKCGKGLIYRPSIKSCQTYRNASRAGVRIKRFASRAKVSRARIAYRYQRPKIARPRVPVLNYLPAYIETPEEVFERELHEYVERNREALENAI